MEGRPLEDAELVDLARDGDVPAYEQLVSRYQGIALRVAEPFSIAVAGCRQ